MHWTEPWFGRWTPGIGDPSLAGWLTVAFYFVAAWTCRQTARLDRPARERRFWVTLTIFLVALGVNKQLDLQSAMTEFGRYVARRQGWYQQRAVVQLCFVVATAACAILLSVIVLLRLRQAPRPTKLSILGAGTLLAFVVVRASSFHHVDRFIGTAVLGFRANWLLEIGGIALIAAGATWRRSGAPARPVT